MSFGRGPFTGAPPTVTEPAVALSIPPIMASSVLLPQPEGPSRHTNSPWRIFRETSSRATTVCEASRPTNVIDTLSMAIIGEDAARASSSRADRSGTFALSRSAATSDFYRDELVVVDRFRFRDEVENAEVLQRIPNDVDGLRIPSAVGGEAPDLGVVNFGDDTLAHLNNARARLHGSSLIGLHKGHGLEPAAQEAAQQFRPFLDHLVGGEDDVGVEMLLDIPKEQDVSAFPLLLQLEAGRRLDHHAVELVALHGGEARRDRP